MVATMNLHLENMGPINEANINIGKITIVGGHNATGKSTLSRLIYSFLRSNSFNREEIACKSIVGLIRNVSRYIDMYLYRTTDGDGLKNFPRFSIYNNYDIETIEKRYNLLKEEFKELDFPDEEKTRILKRFKKIDDLIGITLSHDDSLYISLMRSLLKSEFSTSNFNSLIEICSNSDEYSFNFLMDFKNHNFEEDDAFKSDGAFLLQDVFYVDSVSILDVFNRIRYLESSSIDHFDFLRRNLVKNSNDSSLIFDDKINEEIISLEKDINKIINGKFIYEEGEFSYLSQDGISCDMNNTASGIKQMGIIQLLLANRKLIEDCVLIIDEPEVNLHPEWQMKLAKILTLISKKLNISIYINTHSPLFIEAMYTFSDYYDVSENTTYHLAEEYELGSYNINEVDSANLSKIYDQLGKPYFDMDILRLEKELD